MFADNYPERGKVIIVVNGEYECIIAHDWLRQYLPFSSSKGIPYRLQHVQKFHWWRNEKEDCGLGRLVNLVIRRCTITKFSQVTGRKSYSSTYHQISYRRLMVEQDVNLIPSALNMWVDLSHYCSKLLFIRSTGAEIFPRNTSCQISWKLKGTWRRPLSKWCLLFRSK